MRGDIRLIGGIPPVPPTRENPVGCHGITRKIAPQMKNQRPEKVSLESSLCRPPSNPKNDKKRVVEF